ncbi:MAG TPA: hypothetical protein V6C76_08045 [Drouetiella sp.]
MRNRALSSSIGLAFLASFAVFALTLNNAHPAQAKTKGMAEPRLKGPFLPRAKPFEVTGEVVDSWCFTSQTMGPGRGENHKACGLACAAGGVTLGIVDDSGTLYIAAKHKGYQGCKDLLMPFMARRVHAVGWLAQAGGCNIMKINSVKPVRFDQK